MFSGSHLFLPDLRTALQRHFPNSFKNPLLDKHNNLSAKKCNNVDSQNGD